MSLNKKPVVLITLAIFAALSATLIQPTVASASIFNNWFARNSGAAQSSEGYFSNGGLPDTLSQNRRNCFGSGTLRCPVVPNNNYATTSLNQPYYTSGASSEAKARALIAELRDIYNNGRYGQPAWSQTGAAFIVNTMLGYGIDNPNKTRTVTNAMWADVENRLVERAQAGAIQWNASFDTVGADGIPRDTYVRQIFSGGQWRYDVVYNGENLIRTGMRVYNADGSDAYRLWYLCANPVGAMQGLPNVNFDLTPSVSVNPVYGEPGSNVTVSPTVRNGGTTPSRSAAWQLSTFNVSPTGTVPSGSASSGTAPTAYYGNGAQTVASGSQVFQRNNTSLPASSRALPDLPVGSRVCFALSVQPVSQSIGNWRHSTPVCVVISKSPKTVVTGGDIIVGRTATSSIVTSTNTKTVDGTPQVYGSWGEYAVGARGTITGIASGAGYSGGKENYSLCGASYLLLTSAGTANCSGTTPKGGYNFGSVQPNIGARFGGGTQLSGGTPAVEVNNTPTGIYTALPNATITVNSSGDLGAGRWVVINAPTATVNITSDLRYTNAALSNIGDIPQLVIIANRINIAENVSNVDAWLIASGTNGTINTCSRVGDGNATQLNATICGAQLTVNGPVVAKQLYLYRTAGSNPGNGSGDPAEVFNLRPDAYLWATGYTADAGRLQTISTQELPPRF